MKHILLILVFVTCSHLSFSQKGEIKGTVKDAATGETIIGATILIAEGKGTVTDIDGNYSIKADSGQYTLSISYVGYEPQKLK
ncbi:MAG: carboxypeptidase-like regulatory domain-containing protein [Bacteroidota bacterium]